MACSNDAQMASLRQKGVFFLVEKVIDPWVAKVKGCGVKSWLLVTSTGPAVAWCFPLSGCSNFRCSQNRCRYFSRGTKSDCKKNYHWLPTSANMFNFIGFQRFTLEMLFTHAFWGFSSPKCAQLAITRVGNSNSHFFIAPVRPQLSQLCIYPYSGLALYIWYRTNCSRRPVSLDTAQICSF